MKDIYMNLVYRFKTGATMQTDTLHIQGGGGEGGRGTVVLYIQLNPVAPP